MSHQVRWLPASSARSTWAVQAAHEPPAGGAVAEGGAYVFAERFAVTVDSHVTQTSVNTTPATIASIVGLVP